VEELYGTRYQSGSFTLTNVGSGFHCLHFYLTFSFVVYPKLTDIQFIFSIHTAQAGDGPATPSKLVAKHGRHKDNKSKQLDQAQPQQMQQQHLREGSGCAPADQLATPPR